MSDSIDAIQEAPQEDSGLRPLPEGLTVGPRPRDSGGLFEQLRLVAAWLEQAPVPECGAAILYQCGPGVGACPLPPAPEALAVGRGSSCGLRLPESSRLSRRHFRISNEDGLWQLADLGSHNGTFVVGTSGPITRHLLRDGDIIRAGDETFVFIDQPRG